MRLVNLDGRKMDSRHAAWKHLRESLELPEYFGSNLDALADCLGEIKDISITFSYADAALNSLGDYAVKMIHVFENEAAARKDFRFRLIRYQSDR
jgi:ribonuclease inhibitor